MKSFSLKMLLGVGAFSLAACSGGGGGGGNNAYVMTKDYAPTEAPANAAPAEYVTNLISQVKKSNQVLPDSAAYLDAIIDGGDVKPIYDSSEERVKALQALSSTGLQYLKKIKSQCRLQAATKSESGEVKQGSTQTKSAQAAVDGQNCPLISSESQIVSTTYNVLQGAGSGNSGNMSATLKSGITKSQKIVDANLIASSGLAEMKFDLSYDGNIDASWSNGNMNIKFKMNGTGNASVKLSNGEVVSGPITFEVLAVDQKSQAQFLWNGSSSQGAIRAVILVNSDSKTHVYINGTEMDPSIFSGVGGSFLGSQAPH